MFVIVLIDEKNVNCIILLVYVKGDWVVYNLVICFFLKFKYDFFSYKFIFGKGKVYIF